MKRNRRLRAYAQRVIKQTEQHDAQEIQRLRRKLKNISIFTKGLVQEIGQDLLIGEDGFDYDGFDRKSKAYFTELRDYVELQYGAISRGVTAVSKKIYTMYRSEFNDVLGAVKIDFTNKQIKEQIDVSFQGTPAKSFTDKLRGQLQAGRNPADLITTVGADHVKSIQKELLTAVSKGKGFGWANSKVLNTMFTEAVDETIRKTAEYNVTRIMRTSFMQAVNQDATDFVSANSTVFYGSRRTADGRPCLACIAQDGMFIPPGGILVDHPNGMCILVPLPYPDEFFLNGTFTQPANDVFDTPLLEKFYGMSAAEKRKVFANDALFRLWNKEKFDINKAVVGRFGTPISYQAAVANLDRMGAISTARTGFVTPQAKSALIADMDPTDRLSSKVATRKVPKVGKNSYGIDMAGTGSDYITSRLPISRKAKISALYGEGDDIDWIIFNKRSRELNIPARKDVNGKLYYMIPQNRVFSWL